MDKVITKKKSFFKSTKFLILAGCLLVTVLVIFSFSHKKQVNLDRNQLLIKEVKFGEFEDVVLLNSTVVPKKSILINVINNGSIAEIFVENGDFVKKGQPLVRVYNPEAELDYLTQETAMVEQINNLRNILVNVKNQELRLNEQLLSITNDYKNAKRQYELDSVLYDKGIISKNDFEISQQAFHYQNNRNRAIRKSVEQEKIDRTIQINGINTSIASMHISLDFLRSNKENFTIKSPIDGLLSSFNPELGQAFQKGELLGKIDMNDGYKLEANVDEYYISKLESNLAGEVVMNSDKFPIYISKIHPEIKQGKFEVELFFKQDSLTEDIRHGMSLKSKIFLSGNHKSLLIPKGMFYQDTQGSWVFVVGKNGVATKRKIELGRENPFYYEVKSGLENGEKVIISSYEKFKEMELLNVK
ncbi:efflux RND transporter periplasmic adaptor subunit [Aureivirga sp. CE67]|uniref:efflux RND transporter periplasmic adaptor subunit n=1 Tax=Aureivirga sp. CE67 TaxID=1788983 RepID=UPI0018C92853|nr:HlyD family efflux transporter periplasmic adaptor subunit [Aureivirga sp. CE67]